MASLKQKLKTKTVNQLGFSPGNATHPQYASPANLPTSGVAVGTLALTANDGKLKLWNGVTWANVVYD